MQNRGDTVEGWLTASSSLNVAKLRPRIHSAFIVWKNQSLWALSRHLLGRFNPERSPWGLSTSR